MSAIILSMVVKLRRMVDVTISICKNFVAKIEINCWEFIQKVKYEFVVLDSYFLSIGGV
jgi:hypothetical protein